MKFQFASGYATVDKKLSYFNTCTGYWFSKSNGSDNIQGICIATDIAILRTALSMMLIYGVQGRVV